MEWVFLFLQSVGVIALLIIASRLKQVMDHSHRRSLALDNTSHFISKDLKTVKQEVADTVDELKEIKQVTNSIEKNLGHITQELREINQELISNGRTLGEVHLSIDNHFSRQ